MPYLLLDMGLESAWITFGTQLRLRKAGLIRPRGGVFEPAPGVTPDQLWNIIGDGKS